MTTSLPQTRPTNDVPETGMFADLQETLPLWRSATWEEYVFYRDEETPFKRRIFFHDGKLLVHDMAGEGINHSSFSNLFTMIFLLWFTQKQPEQVFSSLGGCLLEKEPLKAAVPDLILYLGDDYPQWQEGERRRIDLHKWRVPNLIGEVGDTTLATDLDEKKKLYAAMGIPEYWVAGVRGKELFAFELQPDGTYHQIYTSSVLTGLPISVLEQTLEQLEQGTNGTAAQWFAQQIATIAP